MEYEVMLVATKMIRLFTARDWIEVIIALVGCLYVARQRLGWTPRAIMYMTDKTEFGKKSHLDARRWVAYAADAISFIPGLALGFKMHDSPRNRWIYDAQFEQLRTEIFDLRGQVDSGAILILEEQELVKTGPSKKKTAKIQKKK